VFQEKTSVFDPEISRKCENTLNRVRNGEELTDKDIELFAKAFTNTSAASFLYVNGEDLYLGKGGELAKTINLMSGFVTDCILDSENLDQARKMILFFSDVANNCLANKDLNSAAAIISSIRSAPIGRLYSDEIEDNDAVKKKLDELNLLKTEGNFSNLRSFISDLINNNEKFIPYSGMYFTDIEFTKQNSKHRDILKILPKPFDGFHHGVHSARTMQRDGDIENSKIFETYMTSKEPKITNEPGIKTKDDKRYQISLKLKPRA
jgi:hypothetical protein